MVFQEQSLLTNLTVGENIYLGNEAQFTRFGIVDWSALYAAAARQLAKVQVDVDPRMRAEDLDFASRQMVELAKALTLEEHAGGHLVILLDEPTSVLERAEIEVLFSRVRALEIARVLHLRLAPARRGAGGLGPHLRDEGRRGRRRPQDGGRRRDQAASSDGRPQPAGRVLSRAAAKALPRRGADRSGSAFARPGLQGRQLQAPCGRDSGDRRGHRLGPRGTGADARRFCPAYGGKLTIGGRAQRFATPAEAVDSGIA